MGLLFFFFSSEKGGMQCTTASTEQHAAVAVVDRNAESRNQEKKSMTAFVASPSVHPRVMNLYFMLVAGLHKFTIYSFTMVVGR